MSRVNIIMVPKSLYMNVEEGCRHVTEKVNQVYIQMIIDRTDPEGKERECVLLVTWLVQALHR